MPLLQGLSPASKLPSRASNACQSPGPGASERTRSVSPVTWPRQAWGHLLPFPSSGSGAPISRGEAVPCSGPSPALPLSPAQLLQRHHTHRAGCDHSALTGGSTGGSTSEETAYVMGALAYPSPAPPHTQPTHPIACGTLPFQLSTTESKIVTCAPNTLFLPNSQPHSSTRHTQSPSQKRERHQLSCSTSFQRKHT